MATSSAPPSIADASEAGDVVAATDRARGLKHRLSSRSLRRAAWLLGVMAAAGSLALTLSVRGLEGLDRSTVLEFLVGCSFFVSGMVAWSRRENRLGPLMVAAALVWFARPLINVDDSIVFTAAIWIHDTWFLLFALFLLSLPYGRLTSRLDALTMGVLLVVAVPLELAWLSFFETGPPGNALLLWPNAEAANALDWAQRSVIFVGSVTLSVTLWKRWLDASPPLRRILVPALVGGAAVFLSTCMTLLSKFTAPPEWVRWLELCAFIAVPLAVLATIVRSRLARSSVGDVLVTLQSAPPPGELRAALARALDDSSVGLAFWLPEYETYADLDGRPVELPEPDGTRAATPIEIGGARVAALIHDRSLLEEPELLASVGAAASISLDNARLQAELAARLEEVKASRARVIEAGQKERQRLERDLHDGAQQRLVALSLELKLLEKQLAGNPSASQRLDEAQREITQSLEELRAVARGLHPAVLSGHGLAVALEQVAALAPVPVELTVDVDERLPERIETAAYYVVSESLTNVAKHARATRATVSVARARDELVVQIEDDGVGGADPEAGSGMRGLADRVEALGGRIRVWSRRGEGTRVRAELPCGS